MEREYAGRGGGLKRARKPKKDPKRRPRAAYDTGSYKACVARACVKAGLPIFRPNRIRHTYATRVRKEFGLDVAQVMLGRSKADVTQVYAEADREVAADIALTERCIEN
jgi:integrase